MQRAKPPLRAMAVDGNVVAELKRFTAFQSVGAARGTDRPSQPKAKQRFIDMALARRISGVYKNRGDLREPAPPDNRAVKSDAGRGDVVGSTTSGRTRDQIAEARRVAWAKVIDVGRSSPCETSVSGLVNHHFGQLINLTRVSTQAGIKFNRLPVGGSFCKESTKCAKGPGWTYSGAHDGADVTTTSALLQLGAASIFRITLVLIIASCRVSSLTKGRILILTFGTRADLVHPVGSVYTTGLSATYA